MSRELLLSLGEKKGDRSAHIVYQTLVKATNRKKKV